MRLLVSIFQQSNDRASNILPSSNHVTFITWFNSITCDPCDPCYVRVSMKWGWPFFSCRAVSTSTPVSVTSKVCSNWEERFPSCRREDINYEVTCNMTSHLSRETWNDLAIKMRKISRRTIMEFHYLSNSSPVIWPEGVPPETLVNHRLYCETVSWFHYTNSSVFW